MKCLSLWQPWATLIAIGEKKIETRSWYTSYRGPLAIHAAKKWNKELEDICFEPQFREVLEPHRPNVAGAYFYDDALEFILPRGCIVCFVELIDCFLITTENKPSGNEYLFGDYTPGRYAWVTKNVAKLLEPIPFIGKQGLFDIELKLTEETNG